MAQKRDNRRRAHPSVRQANRFGPLSVVRHDVASRHTADHERKRLEAISFVAISLAFPNRLVRDVLEAHGGKMKLKPFEVLLLYTVKPNCDESKCRNDIIGILTVESVSLLETAEVCLLCMLLCCVYIVIVLTCMHMGRQS